jgi:Trk-type K+ transport system membrane component
MAGVNFTLHYRLLVQGSVRRVTADSEFRLYLLVVAGTTLAIAASLVIVAGTHPASAARQAPGWIHRNSWLRWNFCMS